MRMGLGLLVATALALGACEKDGGAPAARSAPTHQTYDARTFFESTSLSLPSSSGFGFSPDGKAILYSNDASGVFNAATLSVDGASTPLTQSTTNATYGVSFFPSDGRVLVTADNGGNELNHIYVRELDGALRDLTPGDKLKASFLGWAADGGSFWVATNERDPEAFDLYSYDATTYARKLAFQNPGFHVEAVSGDGRWVALLKDISSANSNIYVADLTSPNPAPQLITEHKGDVAFGVFDFTRDSKALVYATDEAGEFTEASTYDLATKAKAPLITADWDVVAVSFSPTGRYRVSAVNQDASTRLTILDTQAGTTLSLKDVPPGDLGVVHFDRGETQIAFTVTSDTSPADLFVADLATGEAKRLTTSLNPAIDESMLVAAEVVRYKSFDGLDIPAILYKPKTASATSPAPAIVDVHGGPGGQNRLGYSAQYQHLVNHGYAVLRVNNRGSSGYGKTFYHMDDKKHGDVDLKDVVYARTYLETLDWVDKDHIAVMGGSYGGYMVAAALAFQPDAFDAGINIFGVTNWIRTLESIPPWWGAQRQALFDELGDPAVDGERLRAISPLFHAGNITKPMLVVQGANDPRVLKIESDEIVAAVKANNVPVEYIVFPDEGHGFRGKANRITASEAYLRFLDQHLKPDAATPAKTP